MESVRVQFYQTDSTGGIPEDAFALGTDEFPVLVVVVPDDVFGVLVLFTVGADAPFDTVPTCAAAFAANTF